MGTRQSGGLQPARHLQVRGRTASLYDGCFILALARFLTGNSLEARDDLLAALAIVPGFVQAWVKIASVHMELGDTDATFAAFTSALSHNPNDPDIYYHRGQGARTASVVLIQYINEFFLVSCSQLHSSTVQRS